MAETHRGVTQSVHAVPGRRKKQQREHLFVLAEALRQWQFVARINFYRSLSSMSNRFRSSRGSLARLRRLRQQSAAQRLEAQPRAPQLHEPQERNSAAVSTALSSNADSTNADLTVDATAPTVAHRAGARRNGLIGAAANRRGLKRRGPRRGDWRVRSVRGLGALVVLALLMAAGGRYVRQRLDIENQVRRVLLPQLEKQLGVPIEVGRVESDYLSRVTLHDVVIGRDKRLPLGALLQAPSIRLDIDLIALALHRGDIASDPMRALSGVRLQSPQVVLSRDKRGAFNFERLLHSSTTSTSHWSGRVQVANGRVWFRDESTRSSRGAVLVADARGIDGEAIFNGQSPTRFQARLLSTHVWGATLPPNASPVARAVSIEGEVDAAGRWFSSEVRWPEVSAALLAQYVFSQGEVVARNGALGGVARIAWDAALPVQRRLMLRGQLSLRDVSGFAASLLEPGTRAPLQFQSVSGPLRFENSALSSNGLTGQTLDSPFFASGSLVLPEAAMAGATSLVTQPVFDISLRSDSLDTTRLIGVLSRAKLLRGALIGGGRASGTAHLSGDTRGAKIDADVLVPDFSLHHPQAGNMQARSLHARFQLAPDARSGRATISAPDFKWNQAQTGSIQGRLLQATTRFRFDDRATVFDAVFKTPDFTTRRAASARASGSSSLSNAGGTASGRELNGTLRFASDARGQNLDAQLSSSLFSARLTNVPLMTPRMSTHVARTGASSGDVSLRGQTLRAVLHMRDDTKTPGAAWDAIWNVPGFEARGDGGLARAQLLQGRARFDEAATRQGNRFVRIAARGFAVRHPRIGWLQGRALTSLVILDSNGTPHGGNARGEKSRGDGLRADVSVSDFAARVAPVIAAMPAMSRLRGLKTLRARSLRVVAASDAQSGGLWRGAARLNGLDARAFDATAIAPQMKVRDLGTLSGTARFADIGGDSARVEGDFGLSRALVQDVALRDLKGRVSLADNRVTLSGGRARGENGEYLAEAAFDLKRNTSALSLRAPRVALNARQLNPLLASLGIAVEGGAVGSLSVSNGNAASLVAARANASSSNAVGTGAPVRIDAPVRASFDFFVPRATIRNTKTSSPARAATNAPQAVQIAGARIRGAGVLRQGAGKNWQFGGDASVSIARASVMRGVSRLAGFQVPLWMRGSRLQNLKLTTRGALTRTATGLKPDMTGQLRIKRAILIVPTNEAARASGVRAATPFASPSISRLQTTRAVLPGGVESSPKSTARETTTTHRVMAGAIPPASAGLANAVVSRPIPPREFALDDVNVLFIARANELKIPRFSAIPSGLATDATLDAFSGINRSKASARVSGARLSGHMALRRGLLSGQMLAQSLSAARLQSLMTGGIAPFAARVVDPPSGTTQSRDVNPKQLAMAQRPTTAGATAASAKLSGVVFARVDLAGALSAPQANIQARLYNGALAAGGATVPIDAARAALSLAPLDLKSVSLRALTIWSRGGKMTASGTIAPAHEYSWDDAALDLETRLDGVPLQQLALVPSLRVALRESDVDGLLSGDGHVSGTLNAPRFEGRAALRLARMLGVGIDEATTQIRFDQTGEGPRLEMTQIAAQAEGSTLSGAFSLDAANNEWSAQLQTIGVPTDRLMRLLSQNGLAQRDDASPDAAALRVDSNNAAGTRNASSPRATEPHSSVSGGANTYASRSSRRATLDLPLRGVLRADIDLRGVLQRDDVEETATDGATGADANKADVNKGAIGARVASDVAGVLGRGVAPGNSGFALLPREGHVRLATDTLRWRGRELGALRADFTVRDGLVQSDLTLAGETMPAAPGTDAKTDSDVAAGSDVTAGSDVAAGANGGEKKSASDDGSDDFETGRNGSSALRVRGVLPLSADARALDATISINDARLSLVRETLVEIQQALRERGQSVPNFDLVVARLRAAPQIEGRLALQARLAGSWNDPRVSLSTHVRGARLGKQDLPMLDADLSFIQGAIEIRDLELRQTFPAESETRADDGLIQAKAPAASREERETVLRLAPGGRIAPDGEVSLDAEVLNANLSQLALWLPGLRAVDGRPLLRGDLSLFTFQVQGKTSEPKVVGSLEAQSLIFRNYSLDRLRVARFDIDAGQLRIEPGSLSFVKGGFQSSSAWGRLPWSWGDDADAFGLRRNAPLEVHLPLKTPDFGALSGAFVPALSSVAASEFKGEVEVSGTFDAPQLAGEMMLRDARFRVDPAVVPFDFGVSGLSGTVRFNQGNLVQISGLRGHFAPVGEIEAPATNNLPAALRDTRAARRAIVSPNRKAPRVAGDFALDGSVALDLNPDNFIVPGASLAAHRYDLHLALNGGRFSDETFSGLRNVALRLDWKTGQGAPRQAQNLHWNLSAQGRVLAANKGKKQRDDKRANASAYAAGRLLSVADVRLAPDFATGADAFLRSRFDGAVSLSDFPFDMRDVARGLLNGTLRLDNEPASPVAPSALRVLEARRLKNAKDDPIALARVSTRVPNDAPRLTKAFPTASRPRMSTHAPPVAPPKADSNRFAATAPASSPATAPATNAARDVQSAAHSSGERVTANTAATPASGAVPAAEPPYRVLFSRKPLKPNLDKIDNTRTGVTKAINRDSSNARSTSDAIAADNAVIDDSTQRAQTRKTAPDGEPGRSRARISEPGLNAQNDAATSRTSDSQRVAIRQNPATDAVAPSGANPSGAKSANNEVGNANVTGSAPRNPVASVQTNKATSVRTLRANSTDASAGNGNASGAARRGGAPLRVSGAIVVSEAEAVGAPVGAVGTASVLPDGPILDVRLVAGRNVRFTTPTLRAEFIGALDVRGTPRNPNINGRISTRDGQIRFPNAPARISEGEVAVSVSRDPLTDLIRSRVEIDATARGTVGRYRITLAVKGPLDFGSQGTQNLRVDVSSDPPLSQDEAFAQLTGTSVRDFQDAGNGKTRVGAANEAYARAVVSLLSAPLFAGIERTLEEALGFSSITLDYRFSEPLSVQFGKAVGDRVYVTYRRSLSATVPGQPVAYSLRVDYRIKGGLLLGVQTDERGRRQLTLDRTFRF